MMSGYRAVARRRSAYAAMPVLGVSRRREKKKRLRRDARVGGIAPSREEKALRRDARMGSSQGNQRADFEGPRTLAIRSMSF
jgi:hypothetical protein